MRTAYSMAILELSPAAYQEIRAKLAAAGYEDHFRPRGAGERIDMHDLAVAEAAADGDAPPCPPPDAAAFCRRDPFAPGAAEIVLRELRPFLARLGLRIESTGGPVRGCGWALYLRPIDEA